MMFKILQMLKYNEVLLVFLLSEPKNIWLSMALWQQNSGNLSEKSHGPAAECAGTHFFTLSQIML